MMKNLVNVSSVSDHVISISSTLLTQSDSNNTSNLFSTLGVKSHGTITFGQNKSNKANFIRISSDASAMNVKEFFIRQCCKQPPSLVISITGSAKERSIKSKLFRIFQQNLLKGTQTMNIWIITSGIKTDITKLIGEIVRTNPNPSRLIHLIGIASWKSTSDADQLDVHGENVFYRISKNKQKDATLLESNHTDFIFIDDETRHRDRGELPFRARFERALASTTLNGQRYLQNLISDEDEATSTHLQSVLTPVVLFVIEGDLDTVQQVHEAVVRNNIPVVLLEGTGQCCDLFAQAYHLYNGYHRKETDDRAFLSRQNEDVKNKIRQKMQLMFHAASSTSSTNPLEENTTTTTTTTIIDYFQLIYECIETRQTFLNFVDFKTHSQAESDIDLGIFQAFLIATSGNNSSKSNMKQKQEQLRLALEWDRVDIVKNLIMKKEQDWQTIDLNDLFERALIRNQIAFVQLFLDHDFSLEDLFRDNKKLLMLYKNENHCLRDDSVDPLRAIYTEIVQPLVGDVFDVDAVLSSDEIVYDESAQDVDNPYLHNVISNSSKNIHTKPSHQYHHDITRSKASISSMNTYVDINKELFLWSVLTCKQAFALLFWSRGKNKICAALIATLLYKTKARKDKDTRYNELADEFENLAVQIIEKFYRTNLHTCTKAIIRQIPEFGNMTWLHLAVMAEAKQFIAQRAVQDVLSDIWYGYIDHTVGNRMIIFSTIMLWYSGFLPYHQELVENTETIPQNDNSFHSGSFIQYEASSTKYIIDKAINTKRTRLTKKILDEEGVLHVSDGTRCEKIKTGVSRYFRNIAMFVHAPYVKYLYSLYSHIAFLLLFSYVILCDFFPLYEFRPAKCLLGSKNNNYPDLIDNSDGEQLISNFISLSNNKTNNRTFEYGLQRYNRPANTEILLIIWVFTLFCEEIRQLLSTELQSMYGKIVAHFSVFWNQLDALGLFLFFLALILRFWPKSECFCAARIILAVDLSLWYIRILDIFAAVKQLGPKLVMIGEMVHDMTFFMLILTIFILAFGVPTYSLLLGVQKFTWHLPRAILNLAYWQIFGELEVLDEIEKDYEVSGYVMFIFLISYMTIASILLINLLIAMFSNTFNRLQMDTDCIWKFQHYYLVCHHLTRPSFPPPFIVLSHLWRATVYFFSHIIKLPWFTNLYIRHKNRGKFKIVVDENLTRNIESIEDALGNEVYYFYSKTNRKLFERRNDLHEERVHSPQEMVLKRIKTLENDVQAMQTQQNDMFDYLKCLMNGMKKIGGDEIEVPKQHQSDFE